ncbi:MAG: J domain-containing protein [Bdellovibrionales bacterium]|nr:J domain-containing protein [Bdellovibrionales bacterium]
MRELDLQLTAAIVLTMILSVYDPLWMFVIPSIGIAHRAWVQSGVREARRQLERKIDALDAILEARERERHKPQLLTAPTPPEEKRAEPPRVRVPPSGDGESSVLIEFPRRHGRAHEVLGVPEDADTRLIQRAFRYWIRQYHPDRPHAGSDVEMARKLTGARAELLRRRLIRRYRKNAA